MSKTECDPPPELPPHEQWTQHSPTPTVTQNRIDTFQEKSEVSSGTFLHKQPISLPKLLDNR